MIETKVTEESSDIEYPFIGVNQSGVVVLFTKDEEGTVLSEEEKYHGIGYRSVLWNTKEFKPLKGEITLKNK